MREQRRVAWASMSTRRKVWIAVGVVGAPFLIGGMISGARQELGAAPPAAASSTSAAATSPAALAQPSRPAATRPAVEPTWVYPGDPRCAITYRDRGDGTMVWTATVTVAGELRTHAGAVDGTLYAHDVQVTSGPNAFAAPVPLARINDIGGVLYTPGKSFGCSVAPQK